MFNTHKKNIHILLFTLNLDFTKFLLIVYNGYTVSSTHTYMYVISTSLILKQNIPLSRWIVLQSDHMARLVKVPGIVIQASGVRAKATQITIQCRSCRTYQAGIAVKPGLEGYSLPRKCTTCVHEKKKVLRKPPIVCVFIFCITESKLGGPSVQLILFSLYQTSASVWISK